MSTAHEESANARSLSRDAHPDLFPPRPPRASLSWPAVFVPAAAVSVCEIAAATFTSSAVDRPYAVRCAAASALAVMALAATAGLAGMGLRIVRSPRAAASVAIGLTVSLCGLFFLVNEPSLAYGAGTTAIAAVFAGIAAIAVAAGLVRFVLPLPSPGRLAPFIEPPLLAVALLGGDAILARLGTPLGSPAGTLFEAFAVLLAAADTTVIIVVTRRLSVLSDPDEDDRPRLVSTPAPAHGDLTEDFIARQAAVRRSVVTAVLYGAWFYPLVAIMAFAAGRSPFSAIGERVGQPDVLLVVVDTTRADVLPAPAGSRLPTPAAARLTAGGTRFTSAFSTSCWTLPAHGSLFTGLAPSEHGATWASEHLSLSVTTLAERFQRAGWRTAAFSANPWITPEFGFGRGFERFGVGNADRRPLRPALVGLGVPGPWRGATGLFEDAGGLGLASEALRYLGEPSDPRPAFVFLNLMEPHLPYDPPDEALGSLEGTGWDRRTLDRIDQDRLRDLRPESSRAPRDIAGLRLLYEAEVAYDDGLVGRILDRLEEVARLDGTIVLLTSDHGENLGDHPPLDHQLGLWDSLLHVPLILHYPPRVKSAVDDSLVSLADVPDALLALAGAKANAGAARPASPSTPGTSSGEERAGESSSPAPNGGPLLGAGRRYAVFFEYDRSRHLLGLIRDVLKIDPKPWDRDLTGIRTRDAKWIESTDGRAQAYDLVADPGERLDLYPRASLTDIGLPASFRALPFRLHEAIASRAPVPRPGSASTPTPAMSDEAAEKLRSLGYVR